jgi:hypothetical protein
MSPARYMPEHQKQIDTQEEIGDSFQRKSNNMIPVIKCNTTMILENTIETCLLKRKTINEAIIDSR